MIPHDFLKKRDGKLLGPGALSFPILNKELLMSSLVTGARRRE
jgi:hypothetical protein